MKKRKLSVLALSVLGLATVTSLTTNVVNAKVNNKVDYLEAVAFEKRNSNVTPIITRHPQSAQVGAGKNVFLDVIATAPNGGTLTYQWYESNSPTGNGAKPIIAGTSYIQVRPVVNTYYHVVVGIVGSTKTAKSVVVLVAIVDSGGGNGGGGNGGGGGPTTAITITEQPKDATLKKGEKYTFSVSSTVSGINTGKTNYTWYRSSNSTDTNNATSEHVFSGKNFTVDTNKYNEDKLYFYVDINNSNAKVFSRVAIITVNNLNIIDQPKSDIVDKGTNLTLSVTASSSIDAPLSYQWYKSNSNNTNGTAISGAISSNFDVDTKNYAENKLYFYVIVREVNGLRVTSQVATITINSFKPIITYQPKDMLIDFGGTHTLAVSATASAGSLSYQWYTNDGIAIAGATGDRIIIAPKTTTSYYVIVTNLLSGEETKSYVATVTVKSIAPTITAQPRSGAIYFGQSYTLSVSATAPMGSLSYQWYTGEIAIAGATAATLTVTPESTTTYYVIVTNLLSGEEIISDIATVTIKSIAPIITSQPKSGAINNGENYTLSVNASLPYSGGKLTYQWYRTSTNSTTNGIAIAGATSSKLTVTPTANTYYYVVINNSIHFTTSQFALVTVHSNGPIIISQPQSNDSNYLKVVAEPSRGGVLTYQWYYYTGESSTIIKNATDSSFLVPTPASLIGCYVIITEKDNKGNIIGSVKSSTVSVFPNLEDRWEEKYP